jgi:hypothetical protein
MTDNELKALWNNDVTSRDVSSLHIQVKREYKAFEQDINNRNRLEVIAGVMVILIFGTAAFFIKPMLAKIGALLSIPAACLIMYTLRNVKKYRPKDELPILEHLRQYRIYLNKEKQLLDNIVYWYLLPCAIPLVLFFIGMERYLALVVTIPFNMFIYRLNKKAVKTDILPKLAELDRYIAELEDNSESR